MIFGRLFSERITNRPSSEFRIARDNPVIPNFFLLELNDYNYSTVNCKDKYYCKAK